MEKVKVNLRVVEVSFKMKLTKKRLKEIIKEELESVNEDIGFKPDSSIEGNYMDYASPKRDTSGGMKMFYQRYSSPEAKKVVEGRLADYIQQLRKLEGKLVKDWMQGAKSGAIDFFDLMRGFNTGDVRRANGYEIKFLDGLLSRDKIQDRFRSYFKGRKGKRRN